jgi:ADP-heptose:LPS heptosyltransferase
LGLAPLWQRTAEIADAAAAMLGLDLVIAVDGMPAHLAGSLGRPTWLLLKHDPDWRWMRERADSPWYPSMRLFRQPQPGDWAAVVEQAAAALRNLTAVPTPAHGAGLPRRSRVRRILS